VKKVERVVNEDDKLHGFFKNEEFEFELEI